MVKQAVSTRPVRRTVSLLMAVLVGVGLLLSAMALTAPSGGAATDGGQVTYSATINIPAPTS